MEGRWAARRARGAALAAALPARVAAHRPAKVRASLGLGGVVSAAVSHTGAPVAGAAVEAFGGVGALTHAGWGESDAAGAAATPPLPPGDYRRFVTPPAGSGLGRQWVGGARGSAGAAGAQVVAGGTAPAALRVQPGVRIGGTFRPLGPGENLRYVEVLDAATGARLGVSNTDADEPEYEVWALGGQPAKLHWVEVLGDGPRTRDGWHHRAADFASAAAVPLPRTGRTTVDIAAG